MTAMTQPVPTGPRAARPLRGAAYLWRGLRTYLGTPGIRLTGVVPVLIVGAAFWAALVVLVVFIDNLVAWVTPFADTWSESGRVALRAVVGLAVLALYVALVVLTFAALANLVGQPFYERIVDRVEAGLGGPAPTRAERPWWRSLPAATLESITLLLLTLLCSLPVFLVGLVPVVGQAAALVAGALVSGFFLAIELLGIPLERRGLGPAERFRWAWRHRDLTLGFGVAAFLLFLVPLMNLVAMPAAVVGGTLLVRGASGLPIERARGRP
jgi:CysZ protein